MTWHWLVAYETRDSFQARYWEFRIPDKGTFTTTEQSLLCLTLFSSPCYPQNASTHGLKYDLSAHVGVLWEGDMIDKQRNELFHSKCKYQKS